LVTTPLLMMNTSYWGRYIVMDSRVHTSACTTLTNHATKTMIIIIGCTSVLFQCIVVICTNKGHNDSVTKNCNYGTLIKNTRIIF